MWTPRYFAASYWAPRYWPPSGEVVPFELPDIELDLAGSQFEAFLADTKSTGGDVQPTLADLFAGSGTLDVEPTMTVADLEASQTAVEVDE